MPCETQVLISLIFVIKAVSSTMQWKTLCTDILSAFVDLERYCAKLVCMSLKERSYGLLVKFDVAVCYS